MRFRRGRGFGRHRRRLGRRKFRRGHRAGGGKRRLINHSGFAAVRARRQRATYQPPLGRLSLTQGRFMGAQRFKVCMVEKKILASTSTLVEIGATFSHCINLTQAPCTGTYAPNCWTGSARCPDFYRAIYGWKSMRFTGMKLEIYALPQYLAPQYDAQSSAYVQGIPYSVAGQVTEADYSQTTVSALPSNYATIPYEQAVLTPSCRAATFWHGFRTDTPPRKVKPQRFFSRYMKAYQFTGIKGREFQSIVWAQDTNFSYSSPPTITPMLPDEYILYVAANVNFDFIATAVGTAAVDLRIKRTYYGIVRDHIPEQLADFWSYMRPKAQTTDDVFLQPTFEEQGLDGTRQSCMPACEPFEPIACATNVNDCCLQMDDPPGETAPVSVCCAAGQAAVCV